MSLSFVGLETGHKFPLLWHHRVQFSVQHDIYLSVLQDAGRGIFQGKDCWLFLHVFIRRNSDDSILFKWDTSTGLGWLPSSYGGHVAFRDAGGVSEGNLHSDQVLPYWPTGACEKRNSCLGKLLCSTTAFLWHLRTSWWKPQIFVPLNSITQHWNGGSIFIVLVSLWGFLDTKQIVALFVNLVFLGQAFTIMLVYVWSRRNPYIRMNFFGLLNFQVSDVI